MVKILVLVLGIITLGASKGAQSMSSLITPSNAAESILAKVRESSDFTASMVQEYQKSDAVYQTLIAKIKLADGKTKVACLRRFDELGGLVLEEHKDGVLIRTPYLGNLILIGAMVEFLADKEKEVRNEASRVLLEYVPDLYLRNFSAELIGNIAKNPEIHDAAELLSKTGSEKARVLIRTHSEIRGHSESGTKMALAKLGDSVLEQEFINAYRVEQDPVPKRELARVLGFIGLPKSILALAQDLRNPMVYPWNQMAERSFRVHVIEGLSRAFPLEKILWRPRSTPTQDTYYEAIEKWATASLGVTWNSPRPPFLYEISVPTPAPRR